MQRNKQKQLSSLSGKSVGNETRRVRSEAGGHYPLFHAAGRALCKE